MKMKGMAVVLTVAVAIAAALYAADQDSKSAEVPQYSIPSPQQQFYLRGAVVSRVLAADNIELAGGQRIRLIGVDAPQSVSRGAYSGAVQPFQFYQILRQLIEGKRVNIAVDTRIFDEQGRVLAYVYLEDGTFVNAEVVRRGYAVPKAEGSLTAYNMYYKDYFARLHREAQQNNRGFWK